MLYRFNVLLVVCPAAFRRATPAGFRTEAPPRVSQTVLDAERPADLLEVLVIP
jgi:hypothetical protein